MLTNKIWAETVLWYMACLIISSIRMCINRKGNAMLKIAIKTYSIGLFFILAFFMIVKATETDTYARKSYVTAYNIDMTNGNKSIDFVTETGHEWVNIPTEIKYNVGQEILITFDRNGTTDIINDDYVVLIEKRNVNRK